MARRGAIYEDDSVLCRTCDAAKTFGDPGCCCITPAAAASLLTTRLIRMMGIAAFIAIVSGLIGLYASFYANVSSGAAIVLACTGFFAAAWALRALRERGRVDDEQAGVTPANMIQTPG